MLTPTGSIYLHCDPVASHYLKLLMDAIFGLRNFRNEIVWAYQRWTGATKHFQRMHDILLMYARSGKARFNQLFEPHSEKGRHRHKGRNRVTKVAADGSLQQTYVASQGVKAMRDVWELSYLNANARERIGYPTQKPLSLLNRVIEASSDPGDVVLDPFCGCATACVAADNLQREWVGIDISPKAVELVHMRLRDALQYEVPARRVQCGVRVLRRQAPGARRRRAAQQCVHRIGARGALAGDVHQIQRIDPRPGARTRRRAADSRQVRHRRARAQRGVLGYHLARANAVQATARSILVAIAAPWWSIRPDRARSGAPGRTRRSAPSTPRRRGAVVPAHRPPSRQPWSAVRRPAPRRRPGAPGGARPGRRGSRCSTRCGASSSSRVAPGRVRAGAAARGLSCRRRGAAAPPAALPRASGAPRARAASRPCRDPRRPRSRRRRGWQPRLAGGPRRATLRHAGATRE